MKSMKGQYTLPHSSWVFTLNSKQVVSILLVVFLFLGGGPTSSRIGCVEAGHPNWWTCLKSAFFKDAVREFDGVSREVNRNQDPNSFCTTAKSAAINSVFNKFFENETLMQTTDHCRVVYFDKQNQMYYKDHFFNPICDPEPQVLFDSIFHTHAVRKEISTMSNFYEMLGVTTEMCPDYEALKTDMFKCVNEEAKISDLKLVNYVQNYCIGYYGQRLCYQQMLEKHCKGPWKIGYDRTRVANFESVCSSTNHIQANHLLLFSILAIFVSPFFKNN